MYIVLHEKALSVNKVWKGRRFKSRDYVLYERLLLAILPRKPRIGGEIEIRLRFFLKNCRATDVDNLIKPLLDILVKKDYIEDDRKIYKLTAEKFHAEKDRIEIEITPYTP